MTAPRNVCVIVISLILLTTAWKPAVAADDLNAALAALRGVGPQGAGHRAAVEASRRLADASPEQLPRILAAMDGANRLAMNWIHAGVDAIAERTLRDGGRLPQSELEQFIAEREHNPRARRLAFEWLERVDKTARERLIPAMLDDPSLELRRDAVAMALNKAKTLEADGKKTEAIAATRTALSAARDLDQVDAAAEALAKLGVEVDLPRHFGFLTKWNLIGPFDNTNLTGFDKVFPPEEKIELAAEYQGKNGKVAWFEHQTDDKYGMVDFNRAIGKANGVTAYAYAEFVSPNEQEVELRLGCINGNKVWLNGELLTANEVYHTNTNIDQYIGRGRLKAGANAILVKVCQNEQKEDWAQRWQFQLRVCDEVGTAIHSEKNSP